MNEEKKKIDYFEKKQMVQSSYYLDDKTKNDFATICSRLNSNCNKEICNFVKAFNDKHKEVLNAKRC